MKLNIQRGVQILLFSMLFSCSPKQEAIPGDVLSKEKMVQVMTDVQLVEAVMTIKGYPSDSSQLYLDKYYAHVFSSHGISKEEFKKSFRFYEAHPDLMNDVYDAVIIELSKKQSETGNDQER